MPRTPFARTVAAIATPFRADFSVDFERLTEHARWLFAHGCDGLVLSGTTGEAVSLTIAERKEMLERLIAADIAQEKIVVGTGCCAVADTVELTTHAHRAGVAGVLVLPPYFYKNQSDDGIGRTYDRVIEACGASLPPLYLYHIPQVAGAGVSPDVVERLVERHGAKIRGYKDSSGHWDNTATLLRRFPSLDVFVGSENLLVETLEAGGAGTISAGVNVQPALVREIVENWRAGKTAKPQTAAIAVRTLFDKSGPLIAAIKAVLARIHRHEGWTLPRPPLDPMPEAAAEKLVSELRALGLDVA